MIIQIRGTSGSGKSTVVRRVMDAFVDGWGGKILPGRKQPLYYFNVGDIPGRVAVLGHYNSPCGGCDTIGSAKAVYDLVQTLSKFQCVLSEGLLLSEDVKWSSQMVDLRCLFLDTPLETCIRQIEGRRKAAGNTKPFNTANTSNRVAVIERARVRLEGLGTYCRLCSANKAADLVIELIKESVNAG